MDPYVGEIRLFAGPYVPENWVACNGQLLPVSGNEALYSLLGTTYGGDGNRTFGVPNLQVRLAVGQSPTPPPGMANAYPLAATGGAYEVTLTQANMPSHTHALNATTAAATTVTPGDSVLLAQAPAGFTNYVDGGSPTTVSMEDSAVTDAGGSQPHDNMMPTMTLNYIMCAVGGIYPSFG